MATQPIFRLAIRELGLHYAVGVSYNLTVWRVDRFGNRRGSKIALNEIAKKIPRKTIRKVTWRDGTKKELSARFAVHRVVPCHRDGIPSAEREAVWLVIEWEEGQTTPKYHFSSLPRSTSKKGLIRIIKHRWRTERAYEDLKGELGLDHFEGRRFSGWHHHVSVVLCCYAFIAAERSRIFFPLGPKGLGNLRALHRGLSVTSTTRSLPSGLLLPEPSPGGCHAVRYVIASKQPVEPRGL